MTNHSVTRRARNSKGLRVDLRRTLTEPRALRICGFVIDFRLDRDLRHNVRLPTVGDLAGGLEATDHRCDLFQRRTLRKTTKRRFCVPKGLQARGDLDSMAD
jgi:hypothetical protein